MGSGAKWSIVLEFRVRAIPEMRLPGIMGVSSSRMTGLELRMLDLLVLHLERHSRTSESNSMALHSC